MSGAGILLLSDHALRASLCASDEVSVRLEELQFTLGEGPSVDAFRLDAPVTEPDLAAPEVRRWLAFTSPALDAGAGAVFSFPLLCGVVRVGSLDLYRDRSGALTDDQHADALVLADVVAFAILSGQADLSPSGLATDLEAGVNLHVVVHQAAGMVSAQIPATLGDSLARLRGYAFENDMTVTEVADAVVARRLRFDHGEEA